MKNQLQLVLVALMIVSVGLACRSASGRNGGGGDESSPTSEGTNKSLKDRAIDTAVGKSKIGVPECDEVMDAIEAELNNSEDDFVTKAVKATVLNRIKDSIRQSVEESKGDTVELAKTCREFKTQFEKYKAEQNEKK